MASGYTGEQYWLKKGFLSFEAHAYRFITRDAIRDTPYLQRLIRARVAFKRNKRILDPRDYYTAIMTVYKRKGIKSKSYDKDGLPIIVNDKDGGNSAIKALHKYKNKYTPVDSSGKVKRSPKRKDLIRNKPITRKSGKAQLIAKDRDEIKRLKFMLEHETSSYMQKQLKQRIANHESRIRRLK